ncbi:MAG: PHP domain-containing protein [Nocardioides sp.]|uniref:PHP domain-containing protein n=1 Tax=Nocardioides sp. TaxID=35761 RepID=UPI0039E5981B
MRHPVLEVDHHVHSTFSDDARSTLAENVAAAQVAGLREVRLVEHVRRSTDWVPEFVAAVAGLRPVEGLRIRTGVEAKIVDSTGLLDVPELPHGVETILIADHQFPGTDGPWSPARTAARLADGLPAADALDLLVEAIVRAMRRYPGNQLAHCFSILPKIGLDESQLGPERLRVWAQAAASSETTIEVNEKWGCPGPLALAAALEAGARLVGSTDSHHADEVGRYHRVVELLRAIEPGGSADE